MTNITLLQMSGIVAATQPNEDFGPCSLAFFQPDGVTPIDLTGISFSAKVGKVATLTTGNGISVSGNEIAFHVPVNQWPNGRYPFKLLATDGSRTRSLLASSTLTVGAPAMFKASIFGTVTASLNVKNIPNGWGRPSVATTGWSMDFSDPTYSGYLALLCPSLAAAAATTSLDFSNANNSGYLALLAA